MKFMDKIKNNSIKIIIAISIILFAACCSQEYIYGNALQSISFMDKTTGNNLLFGANKIYNKDSVFVKYDKDTFYQKIRTSNNSTDTFVSIYFNDVATCYIKFSSTDIDTFTVKYEMRKVKHSSGACSQTVYYINSLKYNNIDVPIDESPIKIYK